MRNTNRRRRLVRAAFFFACLGLPIPASAVAPVLHARLLRSTPAADARLTSAPDTIRLVFSEPVVAELSQITLTRSDGSVMQLRVGPHPRDSHVLVAPLGSLPVGNHRVAWRIVSADGHPVAGNFSFSVVAAVTDSPPISLIDSGTTPGVTGVSSPPPPAAAAAEQEMRTPRLVSVLRGLGLGAMMAGVGLLFFGSAAGSRRNLDPGSFVTRLFTVGAALLAAHMAAWLYHISPGKGLSETLGSSVLMSTVGVVELVRVALAVLALWVMAKGRHRIALMFGLTCLAVSGGIGHSAAVQPAFAIPAKIIHLISASIWLGGLLWLVWTFRRDLTAFRIEARRVSSFASFALIAVVITGVVQTQLFLGWPWDVFGTNYGRLVLAKIGGLIALALLGGYNRFRLVPDLDDSRKGARLSRSVVQELVVMTAILLVSGFLANVPIPPPT
ncbi:MAG TPA: copper resistance protein CopC [Gemmatimonadaceae bacterium]|nr:copper resistance protein CopC [Gemmatimonadaceae bacterium]